MPKKVMQKGRKIEPNWIQNGSQNSPPGRSRPKGSGELRVLCAFHRTQPLFCAPFLEHFPSMHLLITHLLRTHPSFCLPQAPFPSQSAQLFWGLCAGESAVQDASIPRDPPRTPFWRIFLTCWFPLVIIFSSFFGIVFFMFFHDFTSLFLMIFARNFRWILHHFLDTF